MVELATIAACLVLGADPTLIASIIRHESAGVESAVHINRWEGDAVDVTDNEIAARVAHAAIAEGYTVDVGLMGINSRNLNYFKQSIDGAFEPCVNIRLGERILMDNIQTAQRAGLWGDDALRGALSLYNTGSLTRGLRNGYVDRIWITYQGEQFRQARYADSRVPWHHGERWSKNAGLNPRGDITEGGITSR